MSPLQLQLDLENPRVPNYARSHLVMDEKHLSFVM